LHDVKLTLPHFEVARVLVRLDHVDCVRNFGVPQPTEWQRFGNQIEGVLVFTRELLDNLPDRLYFE